jgi:hypothetical protein
MNNASSVPAGTPLVATRAKRPVSFQIPGDMAMYAALVGKAPEIDPTLANPMVAAVEARRENPWSPAVLSIYLREICRDKALKMNKPELAAWIRKQSETARKRLAESQMRVLAARRNRAA